MSPYLADRGSSFALVSTTASPYLACQATAQFKMSITNNKNIKLVKQNLLTSPLLWKCPALVKGIADPCLPSVCMTRSTSQRAQTLESLTALLNYLLKKGARATPNPRKIYRAVNSCDPNREYPSPRRADSGRRGRETLETPKARVGRS